MAEFKKLPTQAELQQMLYMGQLQGKSPQDIINENLARGTTIKALPESFFTTAGAGARQAGQFVNRAGTAQDLAKLFPGYTGQSTVPIPTSFNFAGKMDPYSGQVIPGGLQTQQIPYGDILKAIKPADVLGLTGTAQAYSDIGAGKAPNTMDVLDTVGLGAAMAKPAQVGFKVGKGLLEAGGRSLAPTAMDMAYKYAGPGSRIDPAMYVYRPTSASNPDPLVGTQFKREYLGGLIDKTINDLSNKQGAGLLYLPWDNSNRNYKITQVSGEDIPPVVTHGGQDYILDIEHRKKGIGGASGEAIAKRVKTRDDTARMENLAAGGTGEIIHTPTTMARFSENYSVQPTEVMLGLISRNPNSPNVIPVLNEKIRNQAKIIGSGDKKRVTYPFKDFAGVETELGQLQLLNRSSFGGDLRKVFLNKAYGKSKAKGEINFQKEFGFNAEDIEAAVGDPALAGLPRGYGGNAFISSGKNGIILQPSKNATYNTDLTNMDYLGGLGYSAPIETFMGPQYINLAKEQAGKAGDLRSNTIGAIEKRFAGVSTMIDDAMLRRLEDYKKGLLY